MAPANWQFECKSSEHQSILARPSVPLEEIEDYKQAGIPRAVVSVQKRSKKEVTWHFVEIEIELHTENNFVTEVFQSVR